MPTYLFIGFQYTKCYSCIVDVMYESISVRDYKIVLNPNDALFSYKIKSNNGIVDLYCNFHSISAEFFFFAKWTIPFLILQIHARS